MYLTPSEFAEIREGKINGGGFNMVKRLLSGIVQGFPQSEGRIKRFEEVDNMDGSVFPSKMIL